MARLAIVYKNFAIHKNISHIGLGCAALANATCLNAHGEDATVFACRHNIDICQAISEYPKDHDGHPLTHVVISAPWISCRDMAAIVQHFSMIQFCIVSHSNVGFLQADPAGIHLLRDYIELANKNDNLSVGGNSSRFVDWMSEAYNTFGVLLPNMYPLDSQKIEHKRYDPDVIRIGSFGAIRPLKNQLTACAAAVTISKRYAPVEFHLSSGREEAGGSIVLGAIQQMTQDLPNFKLVTDGWCGWTEFTDIVSTMDLLIHPSYTESFNIVSADGIAHGVPVVGSTAITWLPDSWKGDSDNAIELAEIGIRLLGEGPKKGIQALREHDEFGLKQWKKFLAS